MLFLFPGVVREQFHCMINHVWAKSYDYNLLDQFRMLWQNSGKGWKYGLDQFKPLVSGVSLYCSRTINLRLAHLLLIFWVIVFLIIFQCVNESVTIYYHELNIVMIFVILSA